MATKVGVKELVYTSPSQAARVFCVDRQTANSILMNEIVSKFIGDERLMEIAGGSGFTVETDIKGDVLYVVSSDIDPERPHSYDMSQEGSCLELFETESEAIKYANAQ